MPERGYRNETDAALLRAESLEQENEELRSQVDALKQEVSVRLAPVEASKAPVANPRAKQAALVGGLLGGAVLALSMFLFSPAKPEQTMATTARPVAVPSVPGVLATVGLHSVVGTTPVNVSFENRSPTAVRVYWVDYEGREIFYEELAPGASYEQSTYATHPWRVRAVGSNTLLREFVSNTRPTTIRVP